MKYKLDTKDCEYDEWCEMWRWCKNNFTEANFQADYLEIDGGALSPDWKFRTNEDRFYFWIVWV